MKSLVIIGSICLTLAVLLYYFQGDITLEMFFSALNFMGILAGVGVGLIVGGVVGYISKGISIKEKQEQQLQQEIQALRKKVAVLTTKDTVTGFNKEKVNGEASYHQDLK